MRVGLLRGHDQEQGAGRRREGRYLPPEVGPSLRSTASGLGSGATPSRAAGEVQAYSDAFLAGDVPASWAMLSNRCRDRMPMADWEPILRWARGSARV